jgi:20S proteasome subunit beta 6
MSMMFAPRLTEAAAPTTHAAPTWSPYDNNGGTCVAIAGEDYCVIAADTRMSTGFSILTRNHSKIHQITDKSVLASSGFQADIRALQKNLDARHQIYQHQHSKQMSCPAMAQLLSNTLYYKRFFPYYAFNVLGGLDSEGPKCSSSFFYFFWFLTVYGKCSKNVWSVLS